MSDVNEPITYRPGQLIKGIVCSFILGAGLMFLIVSIHYSNKAVQSGCAGYNRTTGELEWTPPLKETK